MKYCVRSLVLLTHCNAAFIKQVLPKLFRPVAPFSAGTMKNILNYIKLILTLLYCYLVDYTNGN